jgi:hypothetical protein
MAVDDRYGSKPAEFARNDITNGTKLDPGPFVGKIKNNVDPTKLGRLQVYVPELASGDEEDPQNWRIVTYSSPYFGMTNQAVSGNTANLYGTTKESYGMWMTPPDIGVLVICIFINGDPNRGYYIGCIPDGTSHYMVPGLAGSKKFDEAVLTEDQIRRQDGAKSLPVVEFNDLDKEAATTGDIAGATRPVHDAQFKRFAAQGILGDNVRGVISSSSQRESPSNVFGFSTPGRPIAHSEDNPSEIWMRQGGHSFVMDDGDKNANDNLIRLRTSGGHQLMMNDTAGIIYLISANGKNWIEMGADGSVRVFSDADISMHATGEINFHSNAAFNVQAPTINMKATGAINMQAGTDYNLQASSNITQVAGTTYGIKATSLNASATSSTISTKGQLSLVGDKILLNSAAATTVKTPAAVPDIGIVPDIEPWGRPDGTTGEVDDDYEPPAVNTAPSIVAKSTPIPQGYDKTKELFANKIKSQSIQEILSTQPTPPGAIGPLTQDQVKALFAGIAQTESGGSYTVVNSIGYSGKYQFGVAALEDMGYVTKGTWAAYGRNSVLEQNVWTGKDGINSRDDFLNSPGIQESVMFNYTKRNYSTMERIGAVRTDDDAVTVAGLLKTAHLLGAGGANSWRKGKGGEDAYGTSGDDYFAQGKFAVATFAPDGTLIA